MVKKNEIAAVTANSVSRAVARILVPELVREVGTRSCIQTSFLLQGILARFGYASRVLSVTAVYAPSGNAAVLNGSAARDAWISGPVFVLGNYDTEFRPIRGEHTMPGFDFAAHAVVLVEQPATLVDLTAHQLNTQGANLPSEILLAADGDFPEPTSRLVGRLPDTRVAAYDWIASDQEKLPTDAGPPATHLDLFAEKIRQSLIGGRRR